VILHGYSCDVAHIWNRIHIILPQLLLLSKYLYHTIVTYYQLSLMPIVLRGTALKGQQWDSLALLKAKQRLFLFTFSTSPITYEIRIPINNTSTQHTQTKWMRWILNLLTSLNQFPFSHIGPLAPRGDREAHCTWPAPIFTLSVSYYLVSRSGALSSHGWFTERTAKGYVR